MSIEEQIEKLPEEKQLNFRKRLMNVLYSRRWCLFHGINYVDPNVEMAKEKLYNEEYAHFAPR